MSTVRKNSIYQTSNHFTKRFDYKSSLHLFNSLIRCQCWRRFKFFLFFIINSHSHFRINVSWRSHFYRFEYQIGFWWHNFLWLSSCICNLLCYVVFSRSARYLGEYIVLFLFDFQHFQLFFFLHIWGRKLVIAGFFISLIYILPWSFVLSNFISVVIQTSFVCQIFLGLSLINSEADSYNVCQAFLSFLFHNFFVHSVFDLVDHFL